MDRITKCKQPLRSLNDRTDQWIYFHTFIQRIYQFHDKNLDLSKY